MFDAVITLIGQSPFYTTLLAAILPTGIFLLFHLRHLRRRRQSCRTQGKYADNQLPQVLPVGWLTTTWQMASSDAPWFLLKWAREIGFVFRVRIPYPRPVIIVGEASLARDILCDPASTKPFTFYSSINVAVGAPNILTANGERWKHSRKAIAPAFSSAQLKRMNQVCKDKLEDWIQRRLKVCCESGEAFDPAQEMTMLTLSTICEAAFEYEMNHEEAAFFLQEVKLAAKEFVLKQGNDPLRATWLGYPYAYKEIRRAREAARNIQAVTRKILNAYRRNATSSSSSLKGTVIELITQNKSYKDDKDRIADMLVFLVAGHDTTGYSIAWALLELARHPHEAEKARNELKGLTSEEERLKSPALDNFIKETMRLNPVSAVGSAREVQHDFRVDDSTVIPKGSVVVTPIILFHRNPRYFDQPDDFLPDRWNNTSPDAAASFMPFVTGPRNCIGQPLATVETHTVIARLLIEYDFEVVDPGKPEFELNLMPSGARLKARTL